MLDRKIPIDANLDGIIDYYVADVVSANDYYPFGMLQPGRSYNAGGYRYGFNGKENDNEVKGEGVQYDYGFRIYDARIGKFLSVDPLFQSYPWYTPYQFAGNTPIQAIDLDGLEEWVVTRWYDNDNNVVKIRIFTVVDHGNSKHINLHFKNSKKIELAKGQKVLYINLKAGSDKMFSPTTTGSALTKEEREIYNSNKKGKGGATYWDLSPLYPDHKTTDYENFTEYNAYKQFKVEPPKPKEAPTKTNTEDIRSSIKFVGNDNTPLGDYMREVKSIVDKVRASNVVDYSITIFGNANGFFIQDFDSYANDQYGKGFKTLGDLAIARANKIRELLILNGLDGKKISTELGNPKKGMSADYRLNTTTKQ